MSAAYFKTIRSILKGCLTCPHRCQNSTLNPQLASFPSVWTDATHPFQVQLQTGAEVTGRGRKGCELLQGFCPSRSWEERRVWRRWRPHPSILWNQNNNGDKRPHHEQAVSPSVVIKTQASWRGKEQPRITEPLLTSAVCWLILSKDSISWACTSSHHWGDLVASSFSL